MTFTVASVAAALGANAAGRTSLEIRKPAEPSQASAEDLALAMDPKFADALRGTRARAALVWDGADWQASGLEAAIFVPRSRYVMAGVTTLFDHGIDAPLGIHPTALVSDEAELGEGASVGPFCVIERGARIGPGARLMAHVVIGANAELGADALLHAGVKVGARVRIGARFIAQPGAVIGADGFSFVTPKPGAIEEAKATGAITGMAERQGFARIHSLAAVQIGDDVEVGANTTIDRGTIEDTRIGSGTKLDNLVQIGHNVKIGETCLVCGQAGVAGSTTVGDRVVLGGQVAVADHLSVGSDVIVTGQSGVSANVPPGRVMMGTPAVKMDLNVEIYKALRRLPRMAARVLDLEKRVSKLDPKD
ncbi:MAG: UDP-3-O-(3-hydroxymyristoyl)glucosamine N-acyltransferase [Pseudomonadota bacterium]